MSLVLAVTTSCSDDDNNQTNQTRTEILSSHVWITTKVTDNTGKSLPLVEQPANTYVGYAYYKADGTFRIIDFKDQPKMFGKWSLTDNETKRFLQVYKSTNELAYERSVDLLTVNDQVFTYRIYPSATDKDLYYDVEHKPVTDHPEPKTPAEVLASVSWKTTNVYDITAFYEGSVVSTAASNPIDPSAIKEAELLAAKLQPLNNAETPASNYAGDAYYTLSQKGYFPKNKDDKYSNGEFKITPFDQLTPIRSQGDWYVSLDGKLRTLYAKDNDGKIIWQRVVSIHQLSSDIFTYDIVHEKQVLRVEHVKK